MKKTEIYEKLYTKDSTGKTRVWWMERDGGSYRTCSGVIDGKIVESEYTVAEEKNTGKVNATDVSVQADKEVKSKYKKQLKTGYCKDVNSVDQIEYKEPMRAKKYVDYKDKIDFSKEKWVLQIKFNGGRCVVKKDGLWSRSGEKFISCPHISKSLEKFFEKHPDSMLDGELFNYERRQSLNEIMSLINKKVRVSQEDLDLSEKLVKFHVYDGHDFDGLGSDVSYEKRKEWIDKNVVGKYDFIEKVDSFPIDSESTLNKVYQTFIDDNQEGGILRKIDEPYKYKRSKFVLKCKPEDDAEAIIVDIKEGDGNWAGTGKVISLKWKGKEFDATFKGTREDCIQFLKDKNKWIGKEITFIYNGLTGLGTPNYARVDWSNCNPK